MRHLPCCGLLCLQFAARIHWDLHDARHLLCNICRLVGCAFAAAPRLHVECQSGINLSKDVLGSLAHDGFDLKPAVAGKQGFHQDY